jgi:hypothetical protein
VNAHVLELQKENGELGNRVDSLMKENSAPKQSRGRDRPEAQLQPKL